MFHKWEAFNFYTTHSVQKSVFVPFLEVILIDSREQNKQDKQISFLRQVVIYPGKFFHLSYSIRQPVALSGEFVLIE